VRLRVSCDVRPRRSIGRFGSIVVGRSIVRRRLTKRRGIALYVPRCASWLATRHWRAQYQQSCGASGHQSRLPVGSNVQFRGEAHKQVSHETIYISLYIQARGALKKKLLEHLRAKKTLRRSKHASLKRNGLGQIKNAISISERPASVEDRAVPSHWEGRPNWRIEEQLHRDPC
jgi:hypothetical protein